MILTVTLNPAIDKVYEVDSFAVGSVFRANKMWVTAGGKGINVARVAVTLNENVIATGFLGGNNGRFIRQQLEKLEIEDAFVEVAEETRTCIAVNDPVGDTSTEILELGPTISNEEQKAFLDNFKDLVTKVDLVAISGSLPSGVPLDFYGELIKISKQHGRKVLLDTSGPALITNLVHAPFMIKPNQQELETMVGEELTEEDILKAADDLHQKGIELVCVTLGAAGSIAVTNEGAFRLRTPTIETRSTVGSGDSFVAGVGVGLAKNMPIQELLKLGMACGMANTQFAETGKISCELVDRFFPMVSIEKY